MPRPDKKILTDEAYDRMASAGGNCNKNKKPRCQPKRNIIPPNKTIVAQKREIYL